MTRRLLISPNNGETAVRGCYCPDDMAVRMRKVLAIPGGVCTYALVLELVLLVPLLLPYQFGVCLVSFVSFCLSRSLGAHRRPEFSEQASVAFAGNYLVKETRPRLIPDGFRGVFNLNISVYLGTRSQRE